MVADSATPPIDTVGIRRDKYRRRINNLKLFAGAMGAGVTLFTAVKISEAGSAAKPALWTGALFLTFIFVAGYFVFRSYGTIQWELDLLNRYLPQTIAEEKLAPLTLDTPMDDAAAILSARRVTLKSTWPLKEKNQFLAAAGFGILAAMLLLFYIWLPLTPFAGVKAALDPDSLTKPDAVDRLVGVMVYVHFDRNRALVPAELEQLLRGIARRAVSKSADCFRVEAHTDDDGPGEYNMDLSRVRASSVRDVLMSEGIPAQRITSAAYGETQPRAAGSSATAKAQNRRVDVSVEHCR